MPMIQLEAKRSNRKMSDSREDWDDDCKEESTEIFWTEDGLLGWWYGTTMEWSQGKEMPNSLMPLERRWPNSPPRKCFRRTLRFAS